MPNQYDGFHTLGIYPPACLYYTKVFLLECQPCSLNGVGGSFALVKSCKRVHSLFFSQFQVESEIRAVWLHILKVLVEFAGGEINHKDKR